MNGGLSAWVEEDGGHPLEVKKTRYPTPSLESRFLRSTEL